MIRSVKVVKLNFSKEKVWGVLTNNLDYSWRSDLSKIEIINKKQFIEYDKKGFPTEFEITNFVPYKIYEFDIKNSNLIGHWIGEISEGEHNSIDLKLTEIIQETKAPTLIVKIYLWMQQRQYVKDLIMKLVKEKI